VNPQPLSYADVDAVAILAKEIRSAERSIYASITTRHDHPTYGYSKTMIREARDRFVGMVSAYGIVTGQVTSIHAPITLITVPDVDAPALCTAVMEVLNDRARPRRS
jgi:hypothetical protein